MKVITAPEQYEPKENDIVCFLAGGITGCKNWQKEVIDYLNKIPRLKVDLVIMNPRRENFPIDDPDAAKEQIEWEFKWLNRADIFSMCFVAGESVQPICMYELGRYLVVKKNQFPDDWDHRIIIGVEEDYKRIQDVFIQTELATGKDYFVHKISNISPFWTHANRIVSVYILLGGRWMEEP